MQTNNNGYGENRKIISGSSVELSPASIGHNSGVAVVTEHEYSFEVIEAMELSWRAVTLPQQIEAAFVHGAGPILDPIKIPAGLQSTTLHKTLFRSQVRLARSDKNLDLRSVLLVLIGAFSANKHCRSTVSATRLAKLLDRSERTIRKYLKVLVDEGYVVRFEQPGFSMALALRLLEVDSNPEVDAVAVLNAIAPHKLGRWGRHDCEPDHLRMTEKSPRNDMASGASMTPESMCSGVRGLTPERNDDDPGTTVVPHNKDSNSSSSGAHTGEDASATLISQSHLNRYYLLVSGWSARPHSADNAPQAFPREQTDRSLRDLVETKARR